METLTDLLKAAKNLHVHHHTKAAAHHDHMAGLHEKCAKAHDAHAAHCEGCVDKASEAGQEHLASHHKAAASFHKTKAAHYEKVAKAHTAHALHHKKMAEAHAAATSEKAYKALEIEPSANITVELEKAAPVVVNTTTDKEVPDFKGFTESITKAFTEGFAALDKKLTDATAATATTATTTATAVTEPNTGASELEAQLAIKSFSIPRTGSHVDTTEVDVEWADLCKIEG